MRCLSDFLNLRSEEAFRDRAREDRDEAAPDDHDADGQDAPEISVRAHVAVPDCGHRADRPPNAVPGRVLLLDRSEGSAAPKNGKEREQRDVAQPLDREQASSKWCESEETSEAKEPKDPECLKACRDEPTDVHLSQQHLGRLDALSRPTLGFPADVMREASVIAGVYGAQLPDIDDPRAQAVCRTTTGT